MRHLAASLILISLAATAQAGGLDDPIIEPVVIADAAAASSAPSAAFVLGLMTLVVLGTAAAN